MKVSKSGNGTAHMKSFGAVDGRVTGSCHVYTSYVDKKPFRIGMDCGIFQGKGMNGLENMTTGISEKPNILFLSHSHLDHIGSVPVLVKEGYEGPIYGTKVTIEGAKIALRDAFTIMNRHGDAQLEVNLSALKKDLRKKWKFVNDHSREIESKKYIYETTVDEAIVKIFGNKNIENKFIDNKDPEQILNACKFDLKTHKITCVGDIDQYIVEDNGKAYTKEHLMKTLDLLKPLDFHKPITVVSGDDNKVQVELIPAGHILGSSQVLIKDKLFGATRFTGDLGRFKDPLYLGAPSLTNKLGIKNPARMIIETTYGDREHADREKETKALMNKIEETKGHVLIPVFANNRSQTFQQLFVQKHEEGTFMPPQGGVVCDGHTSKKFTELFSKSEEYKDLKKNKLIHWAEGKPEDKMSRLGKKAIVITSSGMMTGGAVEQYMDILLDPNSLLVITGYQASATVGEQIVKTGNFTRNGIIREVKCDIFICKSFSSHAAQSDLLHLVEEVKPKATCLVHGELSRQIIFKNELLDRKLTKEVIIPSTKGESYYF